MNQFHDAQLWVIQKIFLDIWIEHATLGQCYSAADAGAIVVVANKWHIYSPSLTQSDQFMFKFISEQLT